MIASERGTDIPFVEARTTVGDFGFNKLQLKVGGDTGKLNYLVNLSDTSIDGYRDHSEFQNTQINARFETTLSVTSSLLATIHHTDQPNANDPGSITSADVSIDPTQARGKNVTFAAGESLQQTRLGLLYKASFNQGRNIETRIYYTSRNFNNKLPFQNGGAVFLNRNFAGGGLKFTVKDELAGKPNKLLVGIDYDRQDDKRHRFNNLSVLPASKHSTKMS